MGTRGYEVYRYKGYYFVWFNPYDSEPEELGVYLAGGVPNTNKGPEQLKAWVERCGKNLQRILDKWHGGKVELDITIQRDAPQTNFMVRWLYTIDLDNLVFCLDSQPLYNLADMPYSDDFIRYIGFDHYGVRSFRSCTPEKFRYKWQPQRVVTNEQFLHAYDIRTANKDPEVSLEKLLNIPEQLTPLEDVRVALMEVLVGHLRSAPHIMEIVHEIQSGRPNKFQQSFCVSLVALAGRSVLPVTPLPMPKKKGPWADPDHIKLEWKDELKPGLVWLRDNLCVLITSRLDEERVLRTSIGEMVQSIKEDPTRTGVLFGVVFSLDHCCLVRLVCKSQWRKRTVIFQHTPVYQFLPTSWAITQITDGITALVRFMFHLVDPLDEAFAAMKNVTPAPYFDDPLFSKPVQSSFSKLPAELCEQIAKHLSPPDMLVFSQLSATCRWAATEALRHPYVEIDNKKYCKLLKDVPLASARRARRAADAGITDDSDGSDNKRKYAHLQSAIFSAEHPTEGDCVVAIGALRTPHGLHLIGENEGHISFFDRLRRLHTRAYRLEDLKTLRKL